MSILARVYSCLFFLLSVASSFTCAAQSTGSVQNSMAIGKMLLGLSFIIILIYALAWVAKRLTQSRLVKNDDMHIVSAMAIGPKEKAILVSVENTKILLGVSAAGVNALHVFENKLQLNDDRRASSPNPPEMDENTLVQPLNTHVKSQQESSQKQVSGVLPQGADFASQLKSMLNIGAGK